MDTKLYTQITQMKNTDDRRYTRKDVRSLRSLGRETSGRETSARSTRLDVGRKDEGCPFAALTRTRDVRPSGEIYTPFGCEMYLLRK